MLIMDSVSLWLMIKIIPQTKNKSVDVKINKNLFTFGITQWKYTTIFFLCTFFNETKMQMNHYNISGIDNNVCCGIPNRKTSISKKLCHQTILVYCRIWWDICLSRIFDQGFPGLGTGIHARKIGLTSITLFRGFHMWEC